MLKQVVRSAAHELAIRAMAHKKGRLSFSIRMMVDVFGYMLYGNNFAAFSMMPAFWAEMRKTRFNNGWNAEQKRQMDKAIALHKGDWVDSEMIHYAVFGFQESNTTLRTVCVTFDGIDKISSRIAAYRLLVRHFLNAMPELDPVKAQKILNSINNGAVVQVNKAGQLIKKLEAKDADFSF